MPLISNYRLTREILLLQQIRHPNVVKLLGFCAKNNDLMYVTEAGRSVDLSNITTSDWWTKLKVRLAILLCIFPMTF